MKAAGALLTDFYQLTMGHAYFKLGMNDRATFELFVRRLPPSRRFLVAAGLAQAVEYLEQLRFSSEELDFLAGLGMFEQAFLDHLARLRFTGEVYAMAEGTAFYADEPILRVTAPILEAQLVESRILNIIHFQTLIASKAARCVLAAQGRQLVDFGLRRAHEADAGLHAARAAYLAGFDATATVEAGRRFGIALSGTVAHSFIEAHDREDLAFRNFVSSQSGTTSLLIDTYDTERAAHRIVHLAHELAARGDPRRIQAVRIDSGDLAAQARTVRAILDEHGCRDIRIVLSGGLDEHAVEEFVQSGVPADAFGVGTSLDVSADAPALDMAYKLQAYSGSPRRKRSPGKATWPGVKQVFRRRGPQHEAVGDEIVLEGEEVGGEPLLEQVMIQGHHVTPPVPLADIRAHCARELSSLPAALRSLREGPTSYPVRISEAVRGLAAQLDARAF
ncbi:MAG TPA: nicotinate phosphoribosyltransferase [Steroidobacteraceae bacterium]|nr:nicotinate phosphoribosyltransferase [Steroidobacteraceae bacterium]